MPPPAVIVRPQSLSPGTEDLTKGMSRLMFPDWETPQLTPNQAHHEKMGPRPALPVAASLVRGTVDLD